MKEAFDKIIERLDWIDCDDKWCGDCCHCYKEEAIHKAIKIVNQVAEEYSNSEIPNKSDGWIPCSGCKDCEHKECEHYGKV